MSETPITDAVLNSLSDSLQTQPGKPMPTAFLCVVSTVNEDGEAGIFVLRPEQQSTITSLGFVHYLDEWFRDDVRYQITELCGHEDE